MAASNDDLLISISTDLTAVKRQLKQLGQDIDQTTSGIKKQFDGMGKSIDQSMSPVQKRINDMLGIANTGAKPLKEWKGALADAGAGLEKVGHAAGATGTSMQAMLHSIRSVGEQLALGVSPAQALTGQLSHLSFVASQPGGISAALKDIGAKAAAMVTAFPLATAAVAVAGAAFVAYELIGRQQIETLDEIVKKHAENIKLLGDAYEEVTGKQQKYALVSGATVNLMNDADAAKVKAKLQAAIGDIFSSATTQSGVGKGGGTREFVKAQFQPFEDALNELKNSAKDTSALQDFISTVTALSNVKPDFKDAGAQLVELSKGALAAAGELPGVTAQVTPLDEAFARLKASIDDVKPDELRKELQSLMDDAKSGKVGIDEVSSALATLSGTNLDLSGQISALEGLYKAAIAAHSAVANTQVLSPLGTISPVYSGGGGFQNEDQVQTDRANATKSQFQIAQEKAAKHSGSKAPKKTADDQFANDIQSIKDRTAALNEEFNSLGLTYEAQTKRQIALQLEQTALKQVREEARKKGDADWKNAQLTPAQIKAIDDVSEAYARQADQLRKAQEMQQLQRDVLQGVFDDLRGALDDGKLNWQDFAKVAEGALDKIISKIENDLITSIMEASNAGGGGSIFGSLLGLLTGSGGGGSSSFGTPGGFAQMLGIPGYANGTSYHPGGMAIVGERGPELLNLPRGAQVMPRVPSINSVSGGQTVSVSFAPNITVQGDGKGDAGQQVTAALKAYQKDFTVNVVKAIREAKKLGMA